MNLFITYLGTSDPYVIFRLGDKKCSSTIKYKVPLPPRLGLLSLGFSVVGMKLRKHALPI
jgi:hypothetical protein